MSKALAEAVRRERKRRKMTQGDLAARFGISQPAVNRWETGATNPADTHWHSMADFLGVDLPTLFGLMHSEDIQPTSYTDLLEEVRALRRDVDMLLDERRRSPNR